MRLYNVDYKFKKYLEMMSCGFNHEDVLRFGTFWAPRDIDYLPNPNLYYPSLARTYDGESKGREGQSPLKVMTA